MHRTMHALNEKLVHEMAGLATLSRIRKNLPRREKKTKSLRSSEEDEDLIKFHACHERSGYLNKQTRKSINLTQQVLAANAVLCYFFSLHPPVLPSRIDRPGSRRATKTVHRPSAGNIERPRARATSVRASRTTRYDTIPSPSRR